MIMRSLPFLLIAGFVLVLMAGEADAKGPVAHWSFDDGEGNTTTDNSGNGYGGTLENGPQWVEGIDGGGLKFGGLLMFTSRLKKQEKAGNYLLMMKAILRLPMQEKVRTAFLALE